MDIRTSYLALARKKITEGNFLWPANQLLKFPLTKLGYQIKRPLTGPYHGIIFVTYRCNYRCVFCDLAPRAIEDAKRGIKELTTQEFKTIIDDFATIGTTGIGFTGGEPMMRNDMLELITYTKKKGMLTHMSHNGSFAAIPSFAKKIIDSGLDAINISLDGTEKTHNWGRGVPTAYEMATKAIENLVELRKTHSNKLNIMVTCVITEKNLDEVEGLVETVKKLGADRIGFMPVQDLAVIKDKAKRASLFNVKTMKKSRKLIDRLVKLRQKGDLGGGFSIDTSVSYLKLFIDSFKKKPMSLPCYAGFATMVVDGYGHYYPCFPWAEIVKPIGNFHKMGLKEFWTSETMATSRDQVRACRLCYWNCQVEPNIMMGKMVPI